MQKQELLQQAQTILQNCIDDRRYLHAHAETGFNLEKTSAYILRRLQDMGIEARRCGRCGVTGMLGRSGKTFLLRADMDALPIREETGLPHACTSGCMHACGHDMHAAMLLGAAQLLKEHESELSGTVKLMFQPAEEILEGAQDMIRAGVLKNPHVDAALMFHVMTAHRIPTGTIIISAPGVSAPAAGTFTVRIQGRGAHGAMPHTGADPITAAAHTLIALQEINARELSPADHAALTIGSLQAGATANVIPDTAELHGSYRAFSDDVFGMIRRRTEEISTGIARVFRTKAELEFHACTPTLINDAILADRAEAWLGELFGREQICSAARLAGSSAARSSGSEDFSAVSHRVPALMLALAAGHPDEGYVHPLHHPKADFDERALSTGAAAHAWFAMKWLQENT